MMTSADFLEKFREQFHIAYCRNEGTSEDACYWMIIRRLPKKKVQTIETVDLDELLEKIVVSSRDEDLPGDDSLTTDQMLDLLVDSDFDLNTLDQWDKIRKSS